MTQSAAAKNAWHAHARRVALKVNFAWWMQRFSAPLLLSTLIGMAALLWFRRLYPDMTTLQWLGMIALAVALIAGICFLFARRNFETPEQSMVRIEAAMRLRSGLSAALAGVSPWPDLPEKIHAGLRWNWQRTLLPPIASLLLLSAGLLVPLHQLAPTKTSPDQPQAWARTESELTQLEEEKVIDQEYIEEVKKKIEDLRAQDPEEWFSHASMEATDHMRKEHRSEALRLEREMAHAAQTLEALQSNPQMGEKEKNRLANEFDQAMQGMQNGAMKANPALREQLKALDPKQLGELSPEQVKQLQQNLQKNAQQLRGQCQQGEGGQGDEWLDELLADGSENGEGKCQGEGENQGKGQGDTPGKGGVNRGPGHDPNLLGKASQALETGAMQGLKATDLSRSLPGDLLELQDGKHDVDTSASKVRSGGAVTDTGKGGDRVWKESLAPQEQKALKKFFE